MMEKYKKAPTWWYAASYVGCVAMTIGFVVGYKTGTAWWSIIVIVVIQLVTMVPTGIMTAMTNQFISLNVVGAVLGGALFPGNLEAAVVFKVGATTLSELPLTVYRFSFTSHCRPPCSCFATRNSATTWYQSLASTVDLRLIAVQKVPPRVVFTAQALGIIVSWLAQTGVNSWALNNIDGICTTSEVVSDHWIYWPRKIQLTKLLVHLPSRARLRGQYCFLGSPGSIQIVRAGLDILRHAIHHYHRRCVPCGGLSPLQAVSEQLGEAYPCSPHDVGNCSHSSCNRDQLLPLGGGRTLLRLAHQKASFSMVDQVSIPLCIRHGPL
jgi:lipid-binding SYLF domain-containing protein